MPNFMIVLISYINLLNLSLIIKCLFLRNMEPLSSGVRTKKSFDHKYAASESSD